MTAPKPANARADQPVSTVENDDRVLTPEEQAAWWRAWVKDGPQGPIFDEPDDHLPDEP